MTFEETPLKGAWIITQKPIGDERGYFARSFCQREFEAHGIPSRVAQCNVSYSRDAGTLRGLHYQCDPAPETKFIRCTKGAIYDVIVDLRKESPTYLNWFGMELTPENRKMLFVPAHLAHGFITLKDETHIAYQSGEFYTPECERGVRYSDPAVGVEWPIEPKVVSEKDQNWPLLG